MNQFALCRQSDNSTVGNQPLRDRRGIQQGQVLPSGCRLALLGQAKGVPNEWSIIGEGGPFPAGDVDPALAIHVHIGGANQLEPILLLRLKASAFLDQGMIIYSAPSPFDGV